MTLTDEEPDCSGCGHNCTEMIWDGECTTCEHKHDPDEMVPDPNTKTSYDGLLSAEENIQLSHEKAIVADMMEMYGGSFVRQLGMLLRTADHMNTRKIREAWPEYWEEYLLMWRG